MKFEITEIFWQLGAVTKTEKLQWKGFWAKKIKIKLGYTVTETSNNQSCYIDEKI